MKDLSKGKYLYSEDLPFVLSHGCIMKQREQNTWYAKIRRTIGAFLPVAKNREGQCQRCGACCHLPVRCWFLKQRSDGTQYCAIYHFRPLNCRKYPRTEKEHITKCSCGFSFDGAQADAPERKTLLPEAQNMYAEAGKS